MNRAFQKYFKSWADVQNEFKTDEPEPDEVLIALYETGNYEGDAIVIYRNNNKYYYNDGAHCSCYGLEGQWNPEKYENKELFLKYLTSIIRNEHRHKTEIEKIIRRLS